jgi:hypothetical protein
MSEWNGGTGDGRLETLLREGRADAFAPGFAGRVMRRLRAGDASPTAQLAAAVQRHFLRLAPAAALLTLALAALNLRGRDPRQSPLDAALGLPPVTADAVFSFEPGPPPDEGAP